MEKTTGKAALPGSGFSGKPGGLRAEYPEKGSASPLGRGVFFSGAATSWENLNNV